jgi:hypothetical protein
MVTPAGVQRPAVRAALLYGAPALAVVLAACLPLIVGGETLILRDVQQTHLMLEAGPARALRAGELPVLDVHRGGGQPFTGNPNALPFYPLRLLYAVAPTLWVLNAHFWLHWLLAPFGLFLLARAWGVGRPGAWAAGVCWATSGYFLSQLNLYNLVAGVALVPFLVAAVLRATQAEARHRHRWAAAAGALWALVIVSGDPSTAVLGAALAAGAVAVRSPRALLAWRTLWPLALAIVLGTLAALPQVTELLRVLPATDRGYRGVADPRMSVGAWRPVHAVEWLVPTPFGRFDLQGEGGFWGRSLFAGHPPLLLSLYPGALAIVLVLASGLPRRRAALWAWAAVAVGALLAAGGATPVGAFLFDLPGARLFRYPVKLWLLAAVGLSLLCGIGFERAFGSRDRPGRPVRVGRVGWPLAGLALVLAGLLALLVSRPDLLEHATFALGPDAWSLQLAVAEWARWIATLATVLALIAALGLCLYLVRAKRRPALGLALLLALHAAGQVHLLRGLLATDDVDRLTRPSPLQAHVPEGSRVAHAGYLGLFGDAPEPTGPDPRPVWPIRQHFDALTPGAGILEAGLRYEVSRTPEGLSSFLLRVAGEAVRATRNDRERLLALSRWGVEHVISERRLDLGGGVPPDLTPALAQETTVAGTLAPIHLYTLRRPAPEVVLADLPVRVPHLPAAWRLFTSPGFDPERHVVLPPAGPTGDAVPRLPEASGNAPGRLRIVRRGDEVLEVETASPGPAVLVAQRAAQPVWRATVDGEPVAIEPANLYRIGVPVPAGRHRVLLRVDRGPLRLALAASAAGLLGLAALAALPVVPGRLRRREAVEVEGAAEDV